MRGATIAPPPALNRDLSSPSPHGNPPFTDPVLRLRGRLLARLSRRYRTVVGDLQFGALTIPFTRIEDPDRVLDEVAAEEDRLEKLSGKRTNADLLHLPYWAELWDSAVGMGIYLEAQSRLNGHPPGPRVLDLGCGMGLSGTVAAALGGRVLFADLETPALLFAAMNSTPWHARVRTRQLNWQTDRLDERFDLILGADILYERKQWDFLEPFWRHHLDERGTILLGEPGRQTGELFVPWIAEKKWTLETIVQPVPTRPTPVKMLRLTARG